MRSNFCKLTLLFMLSIPFSNADAQGFVNGALGLERHADGRTLITASGGNGQNANSGLVFLVEADGRLVHSWQADTRWTHASTLLPGGVVLVADTNNDRIIKIGPSGAILWDSDSVSPFSDGSTLDYPNDVAEVAGGNILISDRDNHRVFEMDLLGNVVWQFGVTGVSGSSATLIAGPHNADRLANGDTLFADSLNNRILQVDSSGSITWQYRPSGADELDWPRDADLMSNGNIVIGDSHNNRIQIVDPVTKIVLQSIPSPNTVFDVDELSNGNFLAGAGSSVELDSQGAVVWAYPPIALPTLQNIVVLNPTSGVNLRVHVHLPAGASSTNQFPAIVRVPAGTDGGQGFHTECRRWARLGFVAVHFDPDGRAGSTNQGAYTTEDWGGHIHQDGLHEILQYVAAMPEVDSARLVLSSESYGLTMAAGALARYPQNPSVALLMDTEGQATRAETSTDFIGGFIPIPASNNTFWSQREALTYMSQIETDYVRLQTQLDHMPGHSGNQHAIDLQIAALQPAFGGAGLAGSVSVGMWNENPINQEWTSTSPPTWIPEALEVIPFGSFRKHQIIEAHLRRPMLSVASPAVQGSVFSLDLKGQGPDVGAVHAIALSGGAGPLLIAPGQGWLNLAFDTVLSLSVQSGTLDVNASAMATYPIPVAAGLANLEIFAQAVVFRLADPLPFSVSNVIPITIQ